MARPTVTGHMWLSTVINTSAFSGISSYYQEECSYRKCNFPMTPNVRELVGRPVCQYFLKGREVTLPCSYRSTCFCLTFCLC